MLLHAFHYGETYGKAVSRDFEVSLKSVQRQLDRFERAGAFISKRQGRTLVYSWNPKSRVASQLAIRMKTCRTSANRMLDPVNPLLTVASLGKVAAALGRKLEFKFVRVPGSPKRETAAKKKNQAIA